MQMLKSKLSNIFHVGGVRHFVKRICFKVIIKTASSFNTQLDVLSRDVVKLEFAFKIVVLL